MQTIGIRRGLVLALLLVLGALFTCKADLALRVYDNGSSSDDDVARVWVDGQDLGRIDVHPGGTNERTWTLDLSDSETHTLRIEFVEDVDAVDLCDEHSGTFGIEFGAGGAGAGDDVVSVRRGTSVDLPVLANDLAIAFDTPSTGTIPCPSEGPAATRSCRCLAARTQFETTFRISSGSMTLERIVSEPQRGTAEIVGELIRYTADPRACGEDMFVYEAAGPDGSLGTATVTVTIDAPEFAVIDDAVETPAGRSVEIDVLANDGDPTLTITAVGAAEHGSICIAGDRICYTPDADHRGSDRFSYTVEDPCERTQTGWVEVDVIRANLPPTADAGGPYQGIVGDPIELSAARSADPNPGDRLEFRWDLDDDGQFDTEWSDNPTLTTTYDAPYVGRAIVEARDVFGGQPAGATARGSALVRIDPPQSIQVLVFEDLDGDGAWAEGEPGLPGVDVALADEVRTTSADGRITFELEAGLWAVALTEESVLALEARPFLLPAKEWIQWLGRGENMLVAFPVLAPFAELTGVVFDDANDNGTLDEGEGPVAGITVALDGGTPVTTDASGGFRFENVSFGSHEVYVTPGGSADAPALRLPFTLSRKKEAKIAVPWPGEL